MQNVKRVEIITDAVELKELCVALDAQGVSGYTVIHDVTGNGHRGERAGDALTNVFKNCLVIAVCEEAMIPNIVEAIRPILKRFGGVCLVSDAQWVIH
jgi:nitrogen regulatory protein PII